MTGRLLDVHVKLNLCEMAIAIVVGVFRELQGRSKKRQAFNGVPLERGWSVNIEGAAGELAFAKATDQFWSGAYGNLRADDVGPFQVRTTAWDRGDLILHKKDADDRPFVLITGLMPNYTIRGWAYARDGKREVWWRDGEKGRTAYFMPQSALTDIRELMPLLPARALLIPPWSATSHAA